MSYATATNKPWIDQNYPVVTRARVRAAKLFGCSPDDLHYVGSAHFGFSMQSGRPFQPGVSDLDIAIVSKDCFEKIRSSTRDGLKNPYLNAGICRPDKVFDFALREEWIIEAKSLSADLREIASDVTFTLYRDWEVFLRKQASAMEGSVLSGGGYTRAQTVARGNLITLADAAHEEDFPLHLFPIEKSRPENSSPYVLSAAEFFGRLRNSSRRAQLEANTARFLSALAGLVLPKAIMVGGSFLNTKVTNPNDIDCVCFYTKGAREVDSQVIGEMASLARNARQGGVDIRLAPLDGDPLVALQISSFFTGLYSSTRARASRRPGVVLIPYAEWEVSQQTTD